MRLSRGVRSARTFVARLDRRRHRNVVGGYWGRLGKLQFDFLKSEGLEPNAVFIDVGCGALRAGTHIVDYLEADNYYGIDIDEQLLAIGYKVELPKRLRSKLPRGHLRCTPRFDVDFGVKFDMGIAHSVFTHISLNDIRLCLYRVAAQMAVGGKFFATFAEAPRDFPLDGILHAGTKRPTKSTERNPYWYWPDDLEWAAAVAPWRLRYIGDWGHPRGQKMVEFLRVENHL